MKQVIVVNDALKLPRGKLAAQVAHAAVAAFLETDSRDQMVWLEVGMPKVVLKGEDEAALRELEQKAAALGLPVSLIEDARADSGPRRDNHLSGHWSRRGCQNR